MKDALPCWVYKSPRKDEMYLYLAAEEGFDPVPEPLLERFGEPVFVMELALHEGRKLARENVVNVMRHISQQGYHLQMPPVLKPDLYHGNED